MTPIPGILPWPGRIGGAFRGVSVACAAMLLVLIASCDSPEERSVMENIPKGEWVYRYDAHRLGGIRERCLKVTGLHRLADSDTIVGYKNWLGHTYVTFRARDQEYLSRYLRPYRQPDGDSGRLKAYLMPPYRIFTSGSMVWVADSVGDAIEIAIALRDAHTEWSLTDFPGFYDVPGKEMLYVTQTHQNGQPFTSYWLGYGDLDSLSGRIRTFMGYKVPDAPNPSYRLDNYIK